MLVHSLYLYSVSVCLNFISNFQNHWYMLFFVEQMQSVLWPAFLLHTCGRSRRLLLQSSKMSERTHQLPANLQQHGRIRHTGTQRIQCGSYWISQHHLRLKRDQTRLQQSIHFIRRSVCHSTIIIIILWRSEKRSWESFENLFHILILAGKEVMNYKLLLVNHWFEENISFIFYSARHFF